MDARKDDQEKLRYDLVPPYPLAELARVYTIGARKYAGWNWALGMAWSRVYAALMRHLERWRAGEDYDPENGQHHLASVAWCAFTLMQYGVSQRAHDDRPHTMQGMQEVVDASGIHGGTDK